MPRAILRVCEENEGKAGCGACMHDYVLVTAIHMTINACKPCLDHSKHWIKIFKYLNHYIKILFNGGSMWGQRMSVGGLVICSGHKKIKLKNYIHSVNEKRRS